jgi:hypothetical protein
MMRCEKVTGKPIVPVAFIDVISCGKNNRPRNSTSYVCCISDLSLPCPAVGRDAKEGIVFTKEACHSLHC